MGNYQIHEVEPTGSADVIHFMNGLATDLFPPLEKRHLEDGYWWLVFRKTSHVVGMAGLVPFEPFPNVGYLKRCFVLPGHRGGLQRRLIAAREAKAFDLGWSLIATETHASNHHSGKNLEAAGYQKFTPEQPWVSYPANYWKKEIL